MKACSQLRPSSFSSRLPAGVALLLAFIVAMLESHSPLLIVAAEKDSDYYPPGVTNPNVGIKMYWKDSVNVLQDLDQFEALYIKYHGCVWTKYGSRYGLGDESDEEDKDEDEVDDNGCGGWGGEFFWYMGQTQCFKANVAYSLYGTLAGENAGSNPCTKSTYINSFFTTFGTESFAGPLGLGVDDTSSQCSSVSPDGAEREDGNEDFYQYVAADDDYLDDNYQFYDYASYTSYGTGCSAEGKFVTDKYSGAFCHGRNYMETLDTLDSFNQAVESMQCTLIYSASNGDEYTEPENNGDGYNFDEMSAVTLLSFSKACSLRQYPHDCPDPYGIKKSYAQNVERAFAYTTGSQLATATKIMNIFSYIFFALGLICWFLSYRVLKNTRQARREARRLERSRSKERRKRSKSTDKKNRSRSKGSLGSRGTSPGSAGSVASLEQAATAASELSQKSWTSIGNAAAAGAEAAKSVCNIESSSNSPNRMKKLFSNKKSGG